jgi:hypothetical protein
LSQRGFRVIDGFEAAFDRKVRDFGAALSGADVGLLFYAGHGLQVSGQNYLLSADAQLVTASSIDWEMVRLDLVQRTMERDIIIVSPVAPNTVLRLSEAAGAWDGSSMRELPRARSCLARASQDAHAGPRIVSRVVGWRKPSW